MKKIFYTISLAILASSCATKSNQHIVYKYIEKPVYYNQCKIDNIPEKPAKAPYKLMKIYFNKKTYYCADEENAKVIANNWLLYKNWCESLYIIIKSKLNANIDKKK